MKKKPDFSWLKNAEGFVSGSAKRLRNFYPVAIENKAVKIVNDLVNEWRSIAAATITEERLQRWRDDALREAGRADALEDWHTEMNNALNEMQSSFDKASQFASSGTGLPVTAWEVDQWSVKQIRQQAGKSGKPTGALDYKPAAVQQAVRQFGTETADLITNVSQQLKSNISREISDGMANGESYQSIRKRILSQGVSGISGKAPFETAGKRARLIARDQIGKLNGRITRARQEQLGITRYIWRSVLDERVRGNPAGKYPYATPSHWNREGVVFSWKNPPEGGHPGEAILCRCWAEPFFEDEHGGDFTKTSGKFSKDLEKFAAHIAAKAGTVAVVVSEIKTEQKIAAAAEVKNEQLTPVARIYNSGMVQTFDETGLHPDLVQILADDLEWYGKNIPRLKGEMQFIGSCQQRNRLLSKKQLKEMKQSKIYQSYLTHFKAMYGGRLSDEKVEKMAEDYYIKKMKPAKVSAVAESADSMHKSYEGFWGIAFNEKYADKKNFAQFEKNIGVPMEKKGWWPEKCSTMKAIVDHEIGHQIDALYALRSRPEIANWHDRLKASGVKHKGNGVAENLSAYASKGGRTEAIAEAWSEFMNNPNPREFAKEFGQIVMGIVKKEG